MHTVLWLISSVEHVTHNRCPLNSNAYHTLCFVESRYRSLYVSLLVFLLFFFVLNREAAATFQRSLDIRQRVLPPDSLETAQGLNNLALLYTSQGQDPPAAERLHREALAIREARLGPNHPEVAQTW